MPESQGGPSTEWEGQDETRKSIPRTGNGKGTGATLIAAEPIAKALNEPATGRRSFVSLRVSTGEPHYKAWARWEQARGIGADLQGASA